MILAYLIAALVVLLLYRSAARYDALHEHEHWTEYDWRHAHECELERNLASMGVR